MLWRRFSPALPQHPRLGLKRAGLLPVTLLKARHPREAGRRLTTQIGDGAQCLLGRAWSAMSQKYGYSGVDPE